MTKPAPAPAPLIGVNGLLDPGDTPRLNLPLRYARSIQRAGGIPVALPPIGDSAELAQMVGRLDGLLLSGGDDFDTERIGLGPTHPAATLTPSAKQDWDFRLVNLALESELPVLGICYGMQLLALATGGDLFQHLPDDRPACAEHSSGIGQRVRIRAGTKLNRLLGVQEVEALCRHHQALSRVGPNWIVSATSGGVGGVGSASPENNLIEAIEHESHPFAIGVQWHPELSGAESPHGALFRGLIDASAPNSHSVTQHALSANQP